MRKSFGLAVLLTGVMALPSYADIANGTFLPGVPQNFTTVYAVDGSTIPGWTVTQGSVDWIGSYWQQPPSGGYSVDLDGLSVGAISQTILTTPLSSYTLSFWMAGNPDGQPDPKTVRVNADAAFQDFTAPRPPNTSNMGWTQKFFSFTATSASTVITFTSLDTPSGNPYGPAIGGVAVPEASFYAYSAFIVSLGGLFKLLKGKRLA